MSRRAAVTFASVPAAAPPPAAKCLGGEGRATPAFGGLGFAPRPVGKASPRAPFLGQRGVWRTERTPGLKGCRRGMWAGVSVKHPTERGSEGRTLFDRAAE